MTDHGFEYYLKSIREKTGVVRQGTDTGEDESVVHDAVADETVTEEGAFLCSSQSLCVQSVSVFSIAYLSENTSVERFLIDFNTTHNASDVGLLQ